eukprot:CAMPEP_0175940504 /NCGR_PEP_ID=MMETSP0108-20121206/23852_1 /TAXON_ID=195067 ORGANISM="Goniomonas pacifica, Strain CCMP1869" /NCGR_SAMPLE_ID=MMETSP0108 /ASSEMBLY_ACC=CAM_ASM_000204 /LENGTH=52 /DNA_ID=CAMNT_0017265001 /DNA_START=776 /DNA_END=934 /DNA_ORIENTATION=-
MFPPRSNKGIVDGYQGGEVKCGLVSLVQAIHVCSFDDQSLDQWRKAVVGREV